MKKLFLTIAAFSALTFSGLAQDARKSAPATQTPEQKADKETAMATKNLNLTDAQKTKFKAFVLERITANKPIREKAKASTSKEEKQKLRAEANVNREKFFNNVNAMLTPEQQTKWTEHHKKMMEKQSNKEHQD